MFKLRIILGACGIHLCIGSVYAWSVLTNHILQATNWSLSEITFTFSLAIFFLGTSAGFLGNKVQEWGATKSGLIAAGFFSSGLLGSALALQIQSLPLLYFSYGIITGTGLGIGYITPISTLLKAFPEHKGFASGCAVMSFGFAALLAGPLMQTLIDSYGLIENFIIVAILYAIIMALSALALSTNTLSPAPIQEETTNSASVNSIMKTWEFKKLWIMFFINIACGIALLSIISPMAQDLGMTAIGATALIGVIGIVNGGGRLFFASISDYLGRPLTYTLFFIIEMFAFANLTLETDIFFFQLWVLLIIACYGGGFSCMPAYLSDLFGMKNLSAIHGRILTAWGLAGIAGPLTLTIIYEKTNSYITALLIFTLLFCINFTLSLNLTTSKRLNKKV